MILSEPVSLKIPEPIQAQVWGFSEDFLQKFICIGHRMISRGGPWLAFWHILDAFWASWLLNISSLRCHKPTVLWHHPTFYPIWPIPSNTRSILNKWLSKWTPNLIFLRVALRMFHDGSNFFLTTIWLHTGCICSVGSSKFSEVHPLWS